MLVEDFFEELRTAFLADKPGNRFDDSVLRPFFQDSISALYQTTPRAFYGRWRAADIEVMYGLAESDFLALDINAMIAPMHIAELRDRVVGKTQFSLQRGQQRGAAQSAQQLQMDTAR